MLIYAQEFCYPISLDEKTKVSDAIVSIKQVNGHIGNDYKQLLINAGICSASATCSCVCCLRPKKDFYIPSERLQKFRDPSKEPKFKDAPRREGANSVIECSKRYAQLTGNGTFKLPKNIYDEINASNGSCFYPCCIDNPPKKQNGGILHENGGWINHFYAGVRLKLRKTESDTDWVKNARLVQEEIIQILLQFERPKKGETTEYR